GVSGGTIKGRLERGRNLLRQRLVRRGVPLTAGLLVALAHSTARAVSPALIQATVAAVSEPSARVAALVRGVTTTMILSKVKLGLGLLLLAGVIAALGSRLPASAPATDTREEERPPPARAAGDAKAPADQAVVSGRVLDESGRPVAGAKLSLWSGKGKIRPAGATGTDGNFRVPLGKADPKAKVSVQCTGQGLDWIDLAGRPAGDVTLRLGTDVPIQGRVLDLEGRPVAGARVAVVDVHKSSEGNLDAYLEAMKNIN